MFYLMFVLAGVAVDHITPFWGEPPDAIVVAVMEIHDAVCPCGLHYQED